MSLTQEILEVPRFRHHQLNSKRPPESAARDPADNGQGPPWSGRGALEMDPLEATGAENLQHMLLAYI
jgi:hypothetical protein